MSFLLFHFYDYSWIPSSVSASGRSNETPSRRTGPHTAAPYCPRPFWCLNGAVCLPFRKPRIYVVGRRGVAHSPPSERSITTFSLPLPGNLPVIITRKLHFMAFHDHILLLFLLSNLRKEESCATRNIARKSDSVSRFRTQQLRFMAFQDRILLLLYFFSLRKEESCAMRKICRRPGPGPDNVKQTLAPLFA